MSYPKDLLSEGEEIRLETRPHWRGLILPGLFLLLLLLPGGMLYAFVDISWLRTGLLILGGIFFLFFILVPFLRWLTTEYVFTSRRIITRAGLVAKNGKDMPLSKVNNVSFDITVFGRILNYGRLTVESASEEGALIIKDVPNVEKVQVMVYRLAEEDDARRRGGSQSEADRVLPDDGT